MSDVYIKNDDFTKKYMYGYKKLQFQLKMSDVYILNDDFIYKLSDVYIHSDDF